MRPIPKPGDFAYKLDVFNSCNEYRRTEYFFTAQELGERVSLLALYGYQLQTGGGTFVVPEYEDDDK